VALVVAPSPVAPLSSLDQSIWSRTDGDIDFQSVALPCFILPCFSRKLQRSTEEQNVRSIFLLITIGNTVQNHGLYLAKSFCI